MASDLQIKTAFKEDFKGQFNSFDSRERIETIEKILEQEIDFENYVQQGVILDHYPLHKNSQETFIKEFD